MKQIVEKIREEADRVLIMALNAPHAQRGAQLFAVVAGLHLALRLLAEAENHQH